jgi:N-acetylmuramoyl-L-alanine amidase
MLFVGLTFVTATENQNSVNNGLNPDKGKMISNEANTNLKTSQVNAKTIHKKFRHKFRYKKYHRKFKRGKGRGDCWSNSEALYNRLRSSGVNARIIQYKTSYSRRHRSVQVYQNGSWVDYSYKKNGFSRRYQATRGKPGLHVIK